VYPRDAEDAVLEPSDVALLLLVVFVVASAFLFPGGPGTPLRMKVGSRP
jgi:hypothetical protein